MDLSLRNPLLNFRITGSTIPLLAAKLSDLEDTLADGNDFQIYPRPTDWEATPRDSSVYQGRIHTNPQAQLLQAEFAQHRLRADIADKDLSNRLTKLYRAARTSIEENGTSTFYLTLGTLIWYETDNSEKPHYAPILLIPMEIIRKSVQSGYLVRAGEDESQLNITLLEMLRQDFGINITGLNTLPTDEHGIDVQKVFTIIRKAIIHKARWDVIEDACMGLFSFSKFVMWHDLKARNQDLFRNNVVQSLMAGSIQWQSTEACSDANLLDTTYHPKDIICPISADSLQLMAITATSEGDN